MSRGRLAVALLREHDRLYTRSKEDGLDPLWESWVDLAEDWRGKAVVAEAKETRVAGTLLELRPDRGARIRQSDGVVTRIPPEQLDRVVGASTAP